MPERAGTATNTTPEPCTNCWNLMGSIDRLSGVMERREDEVERERIQREQEILDLRRANRANKSRWKNARRDFVDVREERDHLRAVLHSILDDADRPYYERNGDEWFLLRIEAALSGRWGDHASSRKNGSKEGS